MMNRRHFYGAVATSLFAALGCKTTKTDMAQNFAGYAIPNCARIPTRTIVGEPIIINFATAKLIRKKLGITKGHEQ
jgi:hypothetical protein